MKRAWAMLVGTTLLLVVGCAETYDTRMERTLDRMKYEQRLNDNLMPPASKGKLEENLIYLRPPRELAGPTKTFQMTVIEPGKFDVESTFIEPEKQSLHVLARVDRPKAATKKAPAAADAVPRGEFNADVVDLIRNVYGVDVNLSQFKEITKERNTFKAHTLDLNAKKVEVYLYGSKNTPHKVALIFEYPKSAENTVSPKIGLCLESFATGEAARLAFAGGEPEEGVEGEPGEAAAPARRSDRGGDPRPASRPIRLAGVVVPRPAGATLLRRRPRPVRRRPPRSGPAPLHNPRRVLHAESGRPEAPRSRSAPGCLRAESR